MAGDPDAVAAGVLRPGTLALKLPTTDSAGLPWVYTLEADVEDVSRQHIANRAAVTVHPAPWYIGVKRVPFFSEQKGGLNTEIVAVGLDGNPVAGVQVELQLVQVQWKSVRRAEGNGFYEWDTERQEVPVGKWMVTSSSSSFPFKASLPSGGDFYLTATGRAAGGVVAATRTSFYALGDGYTAWARYDHNGDRAGAPAADVEAGRNGARDDQVAMGAGDRAGDDRT